jgi:hypothetical protein
VYSSTTYPYFDWLPDADMRAFHLPPNEEIALPFRPSFVCPYWASMTYLSQSDGEWTLSFEGNGVSQFRASPGASDSWRTVTAPLGCPRDMGLVWLRLRVSNPNGGLVRGVALFSPQAGYTMASASFLPWDESESAVEIPGGGQVSLPLVHNETTTPLLEISYLAAPDLALLVSVDSRTVATINTGATQPLEWRTYQSEIPHREDGTSVVTIANLGTSPVRIRRIACVEGRVDTRDGNWVRQGILR